MEELTKHKDDAGPVGDLARELITIVNDFRSGELTLEEKNELVEEVMAIYQAHEHADQEVLGRWCSKIGGAVLALV